ncbi:MAG: hypothetical protein HY320_07065 [Armatimonadetes bacterium]|nr:hypothetical protein [Armatimonadota bacterium]
MVTTESGSSTQKRKTSRLAATVYMMMRFRYPTWLWVVVLLAWAAGPASSEAVGTAAQAPEPGEKLFYSDDPEYIVEPGIVGRVAFKRGQRVRVYFYHFSLMGTEQRFVAELREQGPGILRYKAATVVSRQILPAGRQLTEDWYRARWSERYLHGHTRLVDAALPHRHLCTGLIELFFEHDGEIVLYVGTDEQEAARDGQARRAEYDRITRAAEITVDPAADRALIDRWGTHCPVIPGDYGLDYELAIRFVNPTQRRVRYHLMLHPRGGPATGFLLLDGKPIALPILQTFRPYRFYTFELKPGRERVIRLWTQTAGGSSAILNLEAWKGKIDPIYTEVDPEQWKRPPD